MNNAGIGMRTVNPRFMTHPQGFWTVPTDSFRAVIETNLTGYLLVAPEITPRMLAAGGGCIVNIPVSHPTMHRAGFVPYGPSLAVQRGAVPASGSAGPAVRRRTSSAQAVMAAWLSGCSAQRPVRQLV